MTSDVRPRRLPREPESSGLKSTGRSGEAPKARAPRAPAAIKLRRRQALTTGHDRDGSLFIVRSGVVLAVAQVEDGHDAISSILFPGDVYAVPRSPEAMPLRLVAATPAELWRADCTTLEADMPVTGVNARFVRDNLAHQLARQRLHMLGLATLDGAQRVASLLYDFACRLGKEADQSVVFDMPLTRVDAASYLALNADTLSRIMSRFRSNGVVLRSGRSRIACRDLGLMRRETPFAEAISALYRAAPAYPAR